MPAIEVRALCKTFVTKRKAAGLRGSLRALVRPQLQVVAAAWVIDFCLETMIGLAAFVTEDVAAFEWIYSKIVFVLGGLLIPLDFSPAWLRTALPSRVTGRPASWPASASVPCSR